MLIKRVDFSQDYYEILGLTSKATSDDIKKSYRELAKKYHPDINRSSTSEELFKLISEAYEVLSDDAKRREYDLYRKFALDVEDIDSHAPAGAPPAKVERTKPRHARPAPAADRGQALAMSLLVPGYCHIVTGEEKFGYMIFAIYFIFWALAFSLSMPIGIFAVIVLLYSLYDAYSASGPREAKR